MTPTLRVLAHQTFQCPPQPAPGHLRPCLGSLRGLLSPHVIAFNLIRAAATLAARTATADPARATTATVRRKLIQIPCRIATPARRLTLHLPQDWPWQTGWNHLIIGAAGPPPQ